MIRRRMIRRTMTRRAMIEPQGFDCNARSLRLPLDALDRCHQIFNQGASEFHFERSIFSFRTRPCFVFSWPLRENSTTEFFAKSLPGTSYYHRTGSPAVSPGANPNSLRQECPRYTFSAARIFALRDRGFRSISSSPAVTGFFVSNRYQPCFAPSRIASLTILSSSE